MKDDYRLFLERLEKNPYEGVDLGHGVHKVRMAISDKNKGKSHGARIITFNVFIDESNGTIHLLYIYDKEERSSISKEEISSHFLGANKSLMIKKIITKILNNELDNTQEAINRYIREISYE